MSADEFPDEFQCLAWVRSDPAFRKRFPTALDKALKRPEHYRELLDYARDLQMDGLPLWALEALAAQQAHQAIRLRTVLRSMRVGHV